MIEKAEEIFVGCVAQKAVIEIDGKVLMVKGLDEDAKWDLPGGRLHLNELPEEGLIRELNEELGIDTSIGKLVGVGTFRHLHNPNPFYLVVFAVKISPDDISKIQIPKDELRSFAWMTEEELANSEVYDQCQGLIKVYFQNKI